MTKITTDFVGTESTVVTKSRLTEILAYWGASTAGYTLWGQARTDLNYRLLNTTAGVIGEEELAGSFLPKINFLNDPDAMIATALFGAGEQGVWFDPSDVANLAWRRNLLLWTEQFNNPYWTKIAGGTGVAPTVTANAGTAPDGTVTADRIQASVSSGSTSGADYALVRVAIVVSGESSGTVATNHRYSVYLKSNTGSNQQVTIGYGGGAGPEDAVFTVTSTWTRFSIFPRVGGGGAECDIGVRGLAGTGAPNQPIDILAWGAQLELGSTATEYQRITDLNTEVIARFPNATMYQDAAGTIPVYAPGQPVGLRLDKSKGLVLGPELVTNGTFDTNLTGWSAGNSATITWVSGAIRIARNGVNNPFAHQSFTTVVGRTYRVDFNLKEITGATATVRVGTSAGNDANLNAGVLPIGNGSRLFVATATTTVVSLFFGATADGIYIDFDNISVKELPGNHATQATAASRPLYGIEPAGGRRNLLTYTEQFENAVWAKVRSTITPNAATAPDGTLTADKLVEDTTAGSNHFVEDAATTVAGQHTFSIRAKAGERNWICLYAAEVAVGRFFNLSTGAKGSTFIGAPTSDSIALDAEGFYICSITFTATTSTTVRVYVAQSDASVISNGNGTSGLFLWGAQLERNTTATPYQKVVGDYEVTEAGVPTRHYCVYDGTNDGVLTNSIDFTATDKMSVFAAVTKTSDSTGVIAELSATIDSNNGSFALSSSTAVYNITNKGTTAQSATSPTSYVAPTSGVLTGFGDISGDLVTLLVNGTQVAQSTADQGTGNYGNYPIYIGRRSNGTLPFNGKDYGIIVTGKLATSAQAGNAQNFLLNKLGSLAPVITGVPTIGVN